MRPTLFIVLLFTIVWGGTASAQLANVPMPQMAEVKLPAEARERFNATKTRIENFSRSGNN